MNHPTAPSLRRGYVDAPHGQVHFYDSGGAGTPILLLHQSPAASSDWFAVAPFLAQAGFRVVLMDNPGMGLSDPFAVPPTISEYADVVPVLLDQLGIDQCHLLGHHTGAQIATEAAVRHPHRVASACLYGAPLMSPQERDLYWNRIVPYEMEGAMYRPLAGGTNLTAHFQRIEGLFGPIGAQRLLLSALLAGPAIWHGHNAALRHEMESLLTTVQRPLLLITHSNEMLHANTMAASQLRPDADLVLLEFDGSNAMDDAPGILAEAVVDFVRRAGGAGPG